MVAAKDVLTRKKIEPKDVLAKGTPSARFGTAPCIRSPAPPKCGPATHSYQSYDMLSSFRNIRGGSLGRSLRAPLWPPTERPPPVRALPPISSSARASPVTTPRASSACPSPVRTPSPPRGWRSTPVSPKPGARAIARKGSDDGYHRVPPQHEMPLISPTPPSPSSPSTPSLRRRPREEGHLAPAKQLEVSLMPPSPPSTSAPPLRRGPRDERHSSQMVRRGGTPSAQPV